MLEFSQKFMSKTPQSFGSGTVVEVKALEDILSTLDAQGMVEGVPFMDEMRQFCGRRFRVFKRADSVWNINTSGTSDGCTTQCCSKKCAAMGTPTTAADDCA